MTEEQIARELGELIEVFTRTATTEDMQKLFEELFTQKEKYDFALRWRLLKDLHGGKPQREIASNLGISLCKITRGSRILKTPDSFVLDAIKEYEDDKES